MEEVAWGGYSVSCIMYNWSRHAMLLTDLCSVIENCCSKASPLQGVGSGKSQVMCLVV